MSVQFETNEVVQLEVRKHWFVLAAEMGAGCAAALVPFVLYAVGSVLPITIDAPGNTIALLLFVYAAWLLAIVIVLTYLWTDYYLDVWVITNQRIIDIEQRGLFSREIATMQLSKIQDITTDVSGLIPTMIGFGNVHVQTAGLEREFVIKGVPQPHKVREALEQALAQYGGIVTK